MIKLSLDVAQGYKFDVPKRNDLLMLDIDCKSLFLCRISCVGGTTVYSPVG